MKTKITFSVLAAASFLFIATISRAQTTNYVPKWNGSVYVNTVTPIFEDATNSRIGIGTTSPSANLHIVQTAASTGALKGFIYTGALNTLQSKQIEIPSFTINTTGREWDTGNFGIQREVLITQPTYSFLGASTITDAATLGIAGAPIRSTNASITNTHGLLIQASNSVSTATNSYGLTVNAQTGATNNYAAQFMGGNVGIGTATPGFPLSFANVAGNKIALAGSASADFYGFGVQSGLLQIFTNGNFSDIGFGYGTSPSLTEIMRIKGTGNVGIGTTSPGNKLQVVGDIKSGSTGTNGSIKLERTSDGADIGVLSVENGSGFRILTGGGGSYIAFQTNTVADPVRIIDNGNVGIGTTSPGYKLHVVGNSRFTSDMYLDGQGYYAVGMPWIASDSIFKISIDTLHNALATIKQLKPKSYYLDTANVYGLNFSKKKQYGFIAQEIETILPELITETTKPADYDTTGNVINPALTYKSLNYGAFFGILAKGIQEQSNEIDSLKTKTNNQDSISTALQQAQQQSIDSLRTITVSQDSINVSLQNSLNQLIVKTNYQDSINTSLQDQLNQLLNCCNNNGNNGHDNNLMPSGTHNSEQNNRSIDANDGNLQKTTLTDVELSNKNIVVLNQNVPNPFAEQTTITYFLPDNVTRAQIIFFEQSGKIIKTIDLTEKGKGQLNVFANDLSSGIYTYSLIVDGQIVETKKMVKAK